jgi:hypothetical protein
MLMTRSQLGEPLSWFHTAGAIRNWDVRRVTFKGFESEVSKYVVVDKILLVCSGLCVV